MMLVTKKGLMLWSSGFLALLIILASSFIVPHLSFGEMMFWFFVIQPLSIGWVQRWFWLRSFTKATEGIRDAEKF